MWLLYTSRAELFEFPSPHDVPKGYAILSHTWGSNEQTFQQTPKYDPTRQTTKDDDDEARSRASPKIRDFCIRAERHGFEWAWADTCCIDKSSSAELSEAINSMFPYYRHAEVCYVYLADVSRGEQWKDDFAKSRWHTRGWTLQEFIAPDVVIFFNKYWDIVGSKAQLAELLETITHVPRDILLLEKSLTSISIAGRMRWASERKTTRIEDEAYCLMGIFGVNMPTLYGEGRAAFRRLQEEIMKQSADTSLFAWGGTLNIPLNHEVICSRAWTFLSVSPNIVESDLLAPAPSAFTHSDVKHNPHLPPGVSISPELPTFIVTPYGVKTRIPIIKLDDSDVRPGMEITAALLFCTNSADEHYILLLSKCDVSTTPRGPLYDVGVAVGEFYSPQKACRLAIVQGLGALLQSGKATVEWQKVYLAHRPLGVDDPSIHVNRDLSTPIYIPRWFSRGSKFTYNHCSLPFPWTGEPPQALLTLRLDHGHHGFRLDVWFGRCMLSDSDCHAVRENLARANNKAPMGEAAYFFDDQAEDHEGEYVHPIWVGFTIRERYPPEAPQTPHHDCSQDHVRDWQGLSRTFELESSTFWYSLKLTVHISFTHTPYHNDGLMLKTLTVKNIVYVSDEIPRQWGFF